MLKHQYTCTFGTTVYRNLHHGPAACPTCQTIVEPVVVDRGHGGRPPKFGANMIQTGVHVTVEQNAWLQAQPDGVSETIRRLIDQAR